MDASTASISFRCAVTAALLGALTLALPAAAQTARPRPGINEQERVTAPPRPRSGPSGQGTATPPAPVRRVPTPPPARATLFFCETDNVQCRTNINWFGIDDIRDLHIFAAYRNVTGEHTQQVRLRMPDGNLYQSVETRFTTLASGSGPEVQVAVRSQGEPTVVTVVPVAGTHITQRSLDGTWVIELLLDGKPVGRAELILQPRNPQP